MNKTLAESWIDKAEEDYALALVANRQRKTPLPNGVCYNCQQCAEKYLKAYLISQSVVPRKTHHLGGLLAECINIESKFQSCLPYTTLLNAYSVDYRYPGMDATVAEAKDAVVAIRKMRRIVRRIMGL